jgi:hypothetical protein
MSTKPTLFGPAQTAAAHAALAAAYANLDAQRRRHAELAKQLGYLDARLLKDDRVACWWRCWSTWSQLPTIYAERFDELLAIVVVDVQPLGARLTRQGRDAMHALFAATRPAGDIHHERIEPDAAEAIVAVAKLCHVVRRARLLVPSYLEPAGGG